MEGKLLQSQPMILCLPIFYRVEESDCRILTEFFLMPNLLVNRDIWAKCDLCYVHLLLL